MKSTLRVIAFSFVLATGWKISNQQWQRLGNERLTGDLCGVVGNALETGSLQEIYDGLHQGLVKSQRQDACVAVIGMGNSNAPDCLDPSSLYQTTVCRGEGNKSVRAEIRYPAMPLWSSGLFWIAFGLSLAGLALLRGLGELTTRLSEKISQELEFRMSPGLREIQDNGSLRRAVDWIFDRLGISSTVQRRAREFETRLKEFELRVREEAALRARKEAEADRAAEYIEKVRQIRHDIRSPLSSLFALKDAVEGDELAAQTLGSAIRRIESMLNDLNRVDSEDEKPELTIVEVLAEEALSTHRAKFIQAKGASIVLEYGQELCPVFAVSSQFRRILDNLLENAFDAISAFGVVRIRITRDSSVCHIAVEDNGVGISPEVVSRLFSRGGTFGKANGQGLGLFHAKQSLASWKGSIVCEPLAQGTRFCISLPLAQVGVSFIGLADIGAVSVIDDDPAVSRMLREAGHSVLRQANSFDEGRKLLGSSAVEGETVLVDFRLDNGRFGTELIEDLGGRKSVVLCTSDYVDLELIKQARHLGVRILPKPLCVYAEAKRTKAALASG